MPVPAKEIYTYGNISEQRFSSGAKFSGCRDRPNRNFTSDVAEGKTRGQCPAFCGETPASRAEMMLLKCIKPCFASLYRGVQMCEIYIKPRLFMRSLLMFKGAHEIASLSWFFCVMTKEQNQYQYRNISSNGNIAQHIKIISCH